MPGAFIARERQAFTFHAHSDDAVAQRLAAVVPAE
jgi:hypothetical protein